MTRSRCLLLASQGDEAARIAGICRQAFSEVDAFHGDWGDPLPEALSDWRGDVILSYCSRWIVPQWLLDRASLSLNFHPAPPEYPGIGGLNWALYDGDASFGVTCHHMAAKVDSGPVVQVVRFPVRRSDDAPALFQRTHQHLEDLARGVIGRLASGWKPTASEEGWSGPSRNRQQLDAMMEVPSEATPIEVQRRRRAFEFGRWTISTPGRTLPGPERQTEERDGAVAS